MSRGMTMRMIFFVSSFGVLIAAWFFAAAAKAETTNALSDAEFQGRALTQKILEQKPTTNAEQTGILNIRDGEGISTNLFVKWKISVRATSWLNDDFVSPNQSGSPEWTRFTIVHHDNSTNEFSAYRCTDGTWDKVCYAGADLRIDENTPFAGSDFWAGDLGLEFFHWPEQMVLKKEFHRQCPCIVLESVNPHPTPDGYSRVVSWIDEDSLGIVEAYAYAANGKKLKNFYPKDFQKVNGQYQVQSLIMDNLQTGSRSRLEFNLKR